jgi:DnaK suppressor protein
VSKITAAKAHPAKPATKKKASSPPARAAKSAPKKAAAKSAARPVPRTPPRPAARKSAAAKPAAKAPARKAPARKTPAHAAPHKPAAPAPQRPAAKALTKTPVVKITEPSPKPVAKAATPAAAKPARAPSPRASRTPVVMPQSPPSTLTSSRFADRFAPPKPPTRQMNHLGDDVIKQTYKADPKLANVWKSKPGRELSEAELLSMPDSEYMNDKQLEFFRARLQALKDDLLSNAGETTEHLREDTSIVPDPADRATIEEEHALELRTRDRERKLLKKISQSLARIDAGDYGFCDETGEPIGLGRLIARPTATLSLEAQQRRELKQKMFGD